MILDRMEARGSGGGRSHLRDPDTFDGTDDSKLWGLLSQCYLHFPDRPEYFNSDSRKILFIISHLRGSAQDWFNDRARDGSGPHWDGDFDAFIDELWSNFGPIK